MTIVIPACVGCKNKTDKFNESEGCNAYPDAIPQEIMWGRTGHMKPRGDEAVEGMCFDAKEGFEFFRTEWWKDDGPGGVLSTNSFAPPPWEEEGAAPAAVPEKVQQSLI